MARKLKTYQTSLGFFDLAIAAPSMKAALEAWGSKTNLFHQGFAKEADDPAIVAATMATPGVVLRRAVGSTGSFSEHAKLPKDLASGKANGTPGKHARKPEAESPPHKVEHKTTSEAAVALATDRKRHDSERRRQERRSGISERATADRRSQKPKPRSMRADEPMRPRPKRSQPSVTRSIDGRKPKRSGGTSRRRNCKRL